MKPSNLLMLVALAFVAGCGGSPGESDSGCDGSCEQKALTPDDVEMIVSQAVAQAQQQRVAITAAVVDRVGNVLAVFEMTGAALDTRITSRRVPAVSGGLEGIEVPAALAAISKAGTAAYLSSQGNAFTSRTASQIVQQHFNPGEAGRPGGPLFGVQFTQLPCGDLVTSFPSRSGPHRLPLGLAADPGGIPLYKSSTGGRLAGAVLVGGIGIEGVAEQDPSTGAVAPLYTLDPVITDVDSHLEERIAIAAARGFEAPVDRRAHRIAVDGKFLRFADDERIAATAPAVFEALPGQLIEVPGFADAVVSPGTVHSSVESGHLATMFQGLEAEVLVDDFGAERFPPRSADTPSGMSEGEVRALLKNALMVTHRTRAQIRRPLGARARVTIAVVGAGGEILGIVRARDAPVFGTDTALQKARTAAFFSSQHAAADLSAAGTPRYEGATAVADYVAALRTFLADPTALTGAVAFSDRAGGNLSRPFFPDGIDGNPHGPLSKPFSHWSPFSTGLQLDLVFNALLDALSGQPRASCTDVASLPNGIQIFPGSVPVYRGSTLVGGIGISGDGVDQDDLIAFLGLHQAGTEVGTIGNAAPELRADRIRVHGSHLRFVNCPVEPFLDSDQQRACDGL
jgi:uncharacterized protein GlcG (DUF336 family)